MKGDSGDILFLAYGMIIIFILGFLFGSLFFPKCESESPCDLIENETMKCVNVMNDHCLCDIVECVEENGYEFCNIIEEDIQFDIDKLSD